MKLHEDKEPDFPWRGIFSVFWEMRWQFAGLAVFMVAVHFAIEFRDVLFPHRRGFSLTDVGLAVIFCGMISWGSTSGTNKRIQSLEEKIEDLRRELKSR